MHIKKISVPAMAATKKVTTTTGPTLTEVSGLIGAIAGTFSAIAAMIEAVAGPLMGKGPWKA